MIYGKSKIRRNSDKSLCVKSSVKEYIASKGLRTSAEALEGLDEVIKHHLDKAIERAKAEKRETVQRRHL